MTVKEHLLQINKDVLLRGFRLYIYSNHYNGYLVVGTADELYRLLMPTICDKEVIRIEGNHKLKTLELFI